MRSSRKLWIVFWALLAIGSAAAAAGPGFHVVQRLALGGEGRWDLLSVDSEHRRLYLSREDRVQVVDLDTRRPVGEIPAPGVHGIALAPELNRGFTSNGRDNTASVFDLTTLRILSQVPTGDHPDAICYDPASRRVFVFNGRSHDATVLDAAAGTVAGTIALGGKPELAAADGAGKVFVNLEDTSEVAEIDGATLAVLKRFPLKPGEQPSGLALDVKQHRVYSGCANHLMTVLDYATGSVLATVPIGNGVDGAAFDPATGLAFSSNGEGTVTVVRETAPGKFEAAETVPTQRGARTMALDPKTHTLYLPTAQFGPPVPVPSQEVKHPHPSILKDTFVVLAVGQ